MGALLALASAALYGVVDFAGGLLSRRAHFTVVTFAGQLGGLLCACAVVPLLPATAVAAPDLLWGALSGAGSGMAMYFLNRGLSRGSMSVVVPVSAVTGVALSVLAGVWFLGDRPSPLAWSGIVLTGPALWLVSGGRIRRHTAGGAPVDGLIASVGVAVQYIGLAQADPASGLWPVAAGRLAAVLVLAPGALRHAGRFRQPPRILAQSAAVGAGAAIGLSLYLLAAHEQMLAVAVVLASLYPAIPTLLGLALLRERLTGGQRAGLAGAAVATVLLALG
jgi:drug/metabolite transporter (DMT)-like permease